MPEPDSWPDDVRVLICLECGKEFMFEAAAPPADLTCDKCGNAVFRDYQVSARPDEAEREFREETERDTLPEQGPGEVTRGDVRDIRRL